MTNTNRQVQLGRAAVAPPGEAKPDWWIIQEIARRFGLAWDYAHPREIMNGTVSGWKAYPNPRNIPGYGKQRGWMRVETKSGNSDETFVSVGATQMEIPFDIEK